MWRNCGIVGVAVHLGRAVAVHHAAIVTDDGVAQPPGDGPRRPALPGLHDRLGHLLVHPRHILLGLHGVVVVLLIVLPVGVKALAAMPLRSHKSTPGKLDLVARFAGITFTPGHYLYADADGIVVASRPLL